MAETATEVREQAQEKARETASKAGDAARSQIDERSTQLGERAHSTAGDIRSVGQQLRQQGKDQPAKLADQAAGHVERVGSWLRDSDSDRLLSDIEDFGRRQPVAVALGGLAIGFVAARFLKASSTQRYERRQSQALAPSAAGNGQPSFESGRAAIDTSGASAVIPDVGPGSAPEVPTGIPESRMGVPKVSPAEPRGTLGSTPPAPSRGATGR
jgi:hypothetical protein